MTEKKHVPTEAFILGGATATGKTSLCHQLAVTQPGASILSADAMLVYKGMNVGTAKPTTEQLAEVSYGGLDLVDLSEPFSAGLWLEQARAFIQQASAPLYVTGGTGLYLRALTEGLNRPPASEEVRERARLLYEHEGLEGLRAQLPPKVLSALDDPNNPRRVLRALEIYWMGGANDNLPHGGVRQKPRFPVITRPREVMHQRIRARIVQMFEEGLLDEVKQLRERFPQWSPTAAAAIGYAEALELLDGRMKYEQAVERIATRTRQLAKRQETWLRHQVDAVWILWQNECEEEILARIRQVWERYGAIQLA